jgi:alcohol dehydrogenase class IV
MLPHVVRWNRTAAAEHYAELLQAAGHEPGDDPAGTLAARLEELARRASFPRGLRAAGIAEAELSTLAADAASQWTGRFNPRPFDAAGAMELYRAALEP